MKAIMVQRKYFIKLFKNYSFFSIIETGKFSYCKIRFPYGVSLIY